MLAARTNIDTMSREKAEAADEHTHCRLTAVPRFHLPDPAASTLAARDRAASVARNSEQGTKMRTRKLGVSDLTVSQLCLGTMGWGSRNTEAEGHAQMDRALARGINFIDTAEMYPTYPVKPETVGRTEEIIGTWMKSRKNRDDVVIATKVASTGARFQHVRDGNPKLNRTHIRQAVDASLKRLQTDYIDLYQTHWPERPSNYFSRLGYEHDDDAPDGTPLEETLESLSEQVRAGKIRTIGVSNETPWGVAKLLSLADQKGLSRIVSIQNPYNLLCRAFDIGLAEMAIRENFGLLAYSPLGFGVLSGKYLNGQLPKGSRHQLYPDYMRYFKPPSLEAVAKYAKIAETHNLNLAQMALSYVNSKRFLTANIIGATTLEQLKTNLDSEHLVLDQAVVDAIEAVHTENSNPAP